MLQLEVVSNHEDFSEEKDNGHVIEISIFPQDKTELSMWQKMSYM